MKNVPKPLMIILGVLGLILVFDVMVLFKNGFSVAALGGMVVVLVTGLVILRDFGKDLAKRKEAEAANAEQQRLEEAEDADEEAGDEFEDEEEAVEAADAEEEAEPAEAETEAAEAEAEQAE